jgi:hypothetical protein
MNDVEVYNIEQSSIARILQSLAAASRDVNTRDVPRLNKIMDNIHWKVGSDPLMILRGTISKADVIAESILELPLVSREFVYYIAELCRGDTRQYIGMCRWNSGPMRSQINCYMFIDWINMSDTVVGGCKLVSAGIAGWSQESVHLRIEFK